MSRARFNLTALDEYSASRFSQTSSHANVTFGAVSAFNAMEKARLEAIPDDSLFTENHRESIKERLREATVHRYNVRWCVQHTDCLSMDAYIRIEKLVADKYGKGATTRKAIGDFMLTDSHAVNVKSNNVARQNYSPNMISIQKMHKWVFEQRHDLSFVFVDYQEQDGQLEIVKESELIPIEQISWDCLSIEAQGYGVIQMCRTLKIIPDQRKRDFYRGFILAYEKYRQKEANKHHKFAKRFIRDLNRIDW